MKSTVVDAVIYTNNDQVAATFQDELKKKDVSNVLIARTLDECLDQLKRFPKGLFVVDWAVSPELVNKVLAEAQPKESGELRPMILVSKDATINVVVTASEYGVAQVHSGDLARNRVATSIGHVIRNDSKSVELNDSLAQATRARAKGKTDLAANILKKLHKANPENWRVRAEIAECHIEEGKLDEALKILDGVEKHDPPYLRGLHLVGRCLMKRGDMEGAANVLQRASLLNPHNFERMVDLGRALLQLDRIGEAKYSFSMALEVDPENKDATVGKGQCLLMQGEVEEALALLNEVTDGPELASLFNISAIMSMRQKRFHEGMDLYQAALKALGEDNKILAKLMFNMGIGFRRWRKPEEALKCFEKAATLDPSFTKALEAKSKVVGSVLDPDRAGADEAPDQEEEMDEHLDIR